MLNSLKSALKHNPATDLLAKGVLTVFYNYILRGIEIIKISARKCSGKVNARFQKLYAFKDKYAGKRCFIIANGPSLTLHDCELLQDEYTFGMNAIIDLFDKTSWRPTFYGIQDANVYAQARERLLTCDLERIFVADFLLKEARERERFISYPLYFYDHKVTYFTKNYHTKFSRDAHICIYDGYSITYSLIQLACYFGFTEIYLLGCDCNWPAGSMEGNHFAGSKIFGFENDFSTVRARNLAGYRTAKSFADANGIKIVNCTRGGALEVFPRQKLEDVLAGKHFPQEADTTYVEP